MAERIQVMAIFASQTAVSVRNTRLSVGIHVGTGTCSRGLRLALGQSAPHSQPSGA